MDDEQNINDSAVSPSTQDIVSRLERITRRSLGDVRIHDSEQAGELARRLGARAFTAGRHVYVRPELLRPLTPEGAELLAHELYHVAEQSGEGVTSEAIMPLLRPSSPPRGGRGSSERTSAGAGMTGGSTAAGQRKAAPSANLSVQRAVSGGQSSSEATAEAVAGAVGQQPSNKKRKPAPPDPEAVAEIVYRQIVQELLLDRERGVY